MNELTVLKIEARKLFDKVDQYVGNFANEKRVINSPWDTENLYHGVSFKEQANIIRRKFHSLLAKNKMQTNFHD